MGGFFYNLGRTVGSQVRKAKWVYNSLTGTEADAIGAENEVGRDLAWAFVQQTPVVRAAAAERFLTDLGARLAGAVAVPGRRFRFALVEGAEPNAFALPGGYVFLTRPLLELCAGDAGETAFALGHEMGHVVRLHAIDRVLADTVLGAGLGKLRLGKGLMGAPFAGLVKQLLHQGYSREQELEADRVGVNLAAAAGFDGRAAVRLLARLAERSGDPSLLGGYFSSHPPFEVRIQNVQRFLRE